MEKLTFSDFLSWDDRERQSYLILSKITSIKENFRRLNLFPHYRLVHKVYEDAFRFLHQSREFQEGLRSEILWINPDGGQIIFSWPNDSRIDEVRDLIEEHLPHLEEVLKEGYEVCEVIDSCIKLSEKGVSAVAFDKGFVAVISAGGFYDLLTYFFRRKVVWQERKPIWCWELATTPLIQKACWPVLDFGKLSIIEPFVDRVGISNPAFFEVRSTFPGAPWREAIYPIAKQKFHRYLFKRINDPSFDLF